MKLHLLNSAGGVFLFPMFIAPILEKEQQILELLKSGRFFEKQTRFGIQKLYYHSPKGIFYLHYFNEQNDSLRSRPVKQIDVLGVAIKTYGGQSSLSLMEQLDLLLEKL